MNLPMRTALNWWLASGERTLERLERLLWHWADQSGFRPAEIVRMWEDLKRSDEVVKAVQP